MSRSIKNKLKDPNAIQTVAFVSLGCPKNLVDSERMLGLLAADGIAVTADAGSADAVVINTCGFLEASKTESLKEIRDAIALKTSGKVKRVVVAGCLVQRHKTKLLADAPGIDRLVGVFDREHIVEAVRGKENPRQDHGHYLGKYHDLSVVDSGREGQPDLGGARPTKPLRVFENDRARLRLTPRHYAYLRMSEGCNQGCTFCTIPSIRGPMRSKPMKQILAEAKELAADGAVELNLIGQDTTSYGTDIGDAAGLSGLLRTLDRELKDVHWLRLMYAYPSCFKDEMIDTIAACDRVVKYIDMPLQHISDPVLTMMRRRVTRREIETLLNKLRTRVPGIAIRTTFIAGSPGETDAQHAELVKFVRDFGFDMMGVFPFSPETGTAMGRMDGQLPDDVKQARVEELMLAQQEVAFAKAQAMKGHTLQVLIERPVGRDIEDGWVARSRSQAPDIDSVVFVHSEIPLHAGELLDVKVTDFQAYDLVAEVPRKKSRGLKVLSASNATTASAV
jgi:ribosomal protein S12 methylthiotransferase